MFDISSCSLYDPRSKIYDMLRQMHSDEMKKRWAGPWGDFMRRLKTFNAFLKTEAGAKWREENSVEGRAPTAEAREAVLEPMMANAAPRKRKRNARNQQGVRDRKAVKLDVFSTIKKDVTKLEVWVVDYLKGRRKVVTTVDDGGPAAALAPVSSAGDLTLRAELDALKRELEAPNHKSEYGRFLNVKLEEGDAKDLAALMEIRKPQKEDKPAIKRVKDRFSGRKSRARKEAKVAKTPILKQLVAALTARVAMLEEDLRAGES